MNDTSAHIAALDQTDEEILTPTVSDEAIEAAGEGMLANPTDTGLACCFTSGSSYCCGGPDLSGIRR
jgi:hypothetical protein